MRKRGCSTEIKYKNQVCSSFFESRKNKKHLRSFFKNYPNTPSATPPRTPSFLVGFRRFSPVFAGFRRFPLVFPGYSPVFTGFRRCSPIFADFRRSGFRRFYKCFHPSLQGSWPNRQHLEQYRSIPLKDGVQHVNLGKVLPCCDKCILERLFQDCISSYEV